jgi:acyl-CoA thioesterase FadM
MTMTTHSHKAWTDKGGHVKYFDVLQVASEAIHDFQDIVVLQAR